MNNQNGEDIITIIYKYNLENKIKIFDAHFVENNKNICKIIYKDKEYELKSSFNIDNNNKDIFSIKLKGINNISNASYMFRGCNLLISLPDISKWNTSNVIDMSYLFDGASSLKSLPDLSKWNTENVTEMDYMFSGCSSLDYLPDITKWDTTSLIDIRSMLSYCSSLKSLPDLYN